ncbi:Core-2/I-Branching enzyme [Pseudobutyrivibrio sp. UC1225]|nr:Core-2/I-Branching enzyme [Pseudobutyrivibrio sp. UC1225]
MEKYEATEKTRNRSYKKYGNDFFYKGDQWFSITDAFARYLVANRNKIFKIFKMTNGPDEMFISTMAMNSDFGKRIFKGENGKPDNLRLIDWSRGKPYEFRNKDIEELKASDKLFVRKVSYKNAPKLIENLFKHISVNNN